MRMRDAAWCIVSRSAACQCEDDIAHIFDQIVATIRGVWCCRIARNSEDEWRGEECVSVKWRAADRREEPMLEILNVVFVYG